MKKEIAELEQLLAGTNQVYSYQINRISQTVISMYL